MMVLISDYAKNLLLVIRVFSIHIMLVLAMSLSSSQIYLQMCRKIVMYLKWSDFLLYIMQTLVFICWPISGWLMRKNLVIPYTLGPIKPWDWWTAWLLKPVDIWQFSNGNCPKLPSRHSLSSCLLYGCCSIPCSSMSCGPSASNAMDRSAADVRVDIYILFHNIRKLSPSSLSVGKGNCKSIWVFPVCILPTMSQEKINDTHLIVTWPHGFMAQGWHFLLLLSLHCHAC